jgi:hypothetical protein
MVSGRYACPPRTRANYKATDVEHNHFPRECFVLKCYALKCATLEMF